MTIDRGFGPGPDRGYGSSYGAPVDRGFGPPAQRQPSFVRCGHCQLLQPVGSAGRARCVSCGAPIQQWVAHPPTSGRILKEPAPQRRALPYLGPPSYRGGHPRWSFPPVVWRELPEPDPTATVGEPVRRLRWASWSSAVTAVFALIAAGTETWRFALMLQGRTLVLSGDVVRASDMAVAASGIAIVLSALLTVVFAVPALVYTHIFAAQRLGRAPSRTGRAIVARLLVPLWNVYGAGQIVTEIDRMLAASEPDGDSRKSSRLTAVWWLSWICSSVLMVVTLARGSGGSLQAIADTVELHIGLDLLAAVVAGLGAVMLRRFARVLDGPRHPLAGWVVKPPEPTRPLVTAKAKAPAPAAGATSGGGSSVADSSVGGSSVADSSVSPPVTAG